MEKMKEIDNAIMDMRIKVAKNESVTDEELHELQQLLFKVKDEVKHLQTADEIVREIVFSIHTETQQTAIQNAIRYVKQNPK